MQPLTTGTDNWNVELHVVGERLYVENQRRVLGYNLDDPTESWLGPASNSDSIEDVFIGRDYIVLLQHQRGRPQAAGEPAARYRLLGYARYPTGESMRESAA